MLRAALGAAAGHRRLAEAGETFFEGVTDAAEIPFAVADEEVAAAVDGREFVGRRTPRCAPTPPRSWWTARSSRSPTTWARRSWRSSTTGWSRGERGPAGGGPHGWEDDLFAGLAVSRPRAAQRLAAGLAVTPRRRAAWLAVVEVFWLPLRVAGVLVPVSVVAAVVGNLLLVGLALRLSGSRLFAVLPAWPGLVVVVAAMIRRPEGDLVLTGGGRSGAVNLAFLLLGVTGGGVRRRPALGGRPPAPAVGPATGSAPSR